MSGIADSSQSELRAWLPIWLRGKWGFLGVLFIAYILLNLAWTYFHWGGPQHVVLVANVLSLTPSLLASVIAWRVALQASLSSQVRRAWLLLGSSFFMFLLGNLTWAYLEVLLQVEPFPSLADVFYLAFYPLALWGLLTLPGAEPMPRERLTLWLDLASTLIASTMFVGYFIILPTTDSSTDLLTQLIAAAYPIGSLLLIGGILSLLYRRRSLNSQSALSLLLIGMLFFVASDLAFGYTSLVGTYTPGGWTDAGWNVAQLFFALAALRRLAEKPASAFMQQWITLRDHLQPWLAPFVIALAYGLVFYVVVINDGRAADSLMAGAMGMTLLIVSRHIVSPAFADLPIRIKVILTLIMVSVLSVGLVSATAYLTIRSNLQSLAGESLKAQVKLRSQALGSEISKQLDLIEWLVLSEMIEYGVSKANGDYAEDEPAIESQLREREHDWKAMPDTNPVVRSVLTNAMAQELYEFQKNFPHHLDLVLTDRYGATIAATARPGSYSQATQDWWQAAYNQGRGAVYLGQPILDPSTQKFLMIMAVPVRADDGQEVIGVLRTTFRIQAVLELLMPSHSENQAGFHLLLPDGSLLDPHGETQILDPQMLARLQASEDAMYAQLDFEGIPHMLSQARLALSDADESAVLQNLDWILLAHEKPSTTFAPLDAGWRTALLATLIVLFLTSGVAIILAQVLIAPISRLTGVAAQIAAGDFTTKAQIESVDEVGTLAGTFNSMLDALSRTQEELRERETLYRSLVEYSPDMIAVHANGKFVFLNPAGVKLTGAKCAEEVIGKPFLEMIPEDEHEWTQQSMEAVAVSGEATSLYQRKMHRVDGTSFEAEYRAIPIMHASQPAIQWVVRDITERKRAEEQIHQLLAQVARQRGELEIRVEERTAELQTLNRQLQGELVERQQLMLSLRESEQRFRLLFDASPDAILLLDPNDESVSWPIVDCNEIACTMNGYTREELIGQSIDVLHRAPDDPAERQAYLEFLRQQGVLHTDGLHRHKDGHIFPIEVSTSLIRFGDRELVLGIDRDITERKQAELALQQAKESAEESRHVAEAASRAKSEFLSRMSHELRTPMNAILGFAQLLEMSHKEPLTSTQKERVKQIVKGGQHLLDLINEILDISRIEANRLHISPEPVLVREGIQEALDLTVPLAAKRKIQIVTKLDGMENKAFVMADRQRFKQVLLNLLGNAVKYNYDEGSVIISCERAPLGRWRISIADTGPGISRENQARLFIPFERLGADQPNVEGTGLGLVLAKRLIELMHGQIGLESIVGNGSTFWFELPSAESPVERLQRAGGTGELPVLSTSARTILYVEDNVANFELIKQVLADYSQINLLWAADVKTGIELAWNSHPNLILLDLHLGGTDGADILRQLKQNKETAEIPVVVVSADATPGQVQRLLSWGAYSYLTKPLDVRHFVRLMKELLVEEEA